MNNRNNSLKRYSMKALCFMLVMLFLFPACSYALADETSGQTGSITIVYSVEGASFSIYKVGKWDDDEGYLLDEPYASYGVNTNSSSAASSLASYILRDQESEDAITPLAEQATSDEKMYDNKYTTAFTNLEEATYLIIGKSITVDNVTYNALPLLVNLPYSGDAGEPSWNVLVEPKHEKFEPGKEKTSVKVQKVWKNDDKETRPASITVQLLKDGKTFESTEELKCEVELSESNNWSYEWPELDSSCNWTVQEKEVPKGYLLSTSSDNDTIVLVNTLQKLPNNEPEEPSKTPEGTKKLPKTGQEWIPILFLITAGLFFILIGLILVKRSNRR